MNDPGIGHNAPTTAEMIGIALKDISSFLAAVPAIQEHEQMKQAKGLIDIARNALREFDAERTAKVKPLNERVRDINAEYRSKSDLLEHLAEELKTRGRAFLIVEEERRQAEADKARQEKIAAEEAAAHAAKDEHEARENAAAGEVGVALEGAIMDTRQALAAARAAGRAAAIAQKDVHVRVADGYGRSASLRTREVPTVVNAFKALDALGLTDKIRDAILSEARAFKLTNGTWPPGVEVRTEQTL